MPTYQEKTTIVQNEPIRVEPTPPIHTEHTERVVVVRRPMSNGVIAALVITGVVAAALITYLIVNNQQRKQDTDLALQQSSQAQANATDAQRQANSQPVNAPASQQPIIVTVPSPSQPAAAPAPAPVPADNSAANSAANTSLETDVTLKLTDDKELVQYQITPRANGGVVTLTGTVPTVALRVKAADIAKGVNGVATVVNKIAVS